MSQDFIRETTRNQIAEQLRTAFFDYYRYQPAPSEVHSWRNSLRAMKDVMQESALLDHGVFLEYQLPLNSRRIDCMLCGHDAADAEQAVIVELKQWDKCEASDADKLVSSWVGGGRRELLHPSVQVGQYRQYLADTHSAFNEGQPPVGLSACAYLHNYFPVEEDPILAPKFNDVIRENPLFDANSPVALGSFLQPRLEAAGGKSVLQRIDEGRFRQSRKLMDHVANAIKSHSPWILLDEQLVVYESIRAAAKLNLSGSRKRVVIVRGGPGTGKSVLAINLMADLLRAGKNAQYATGSKAFTETLWSIMGSRSRANFKYFNSYGQAEPGEIDVLICDESHRIRKTSNNRFTRKEFRSEQPQIREILDAAKVSVFFIDDRQCVRPDETGSSAYIREHAESAGAETSEYELEAQFRCSGSDGFVNWIDNTLGIRRTANVIWDGVDGFDFQIVVSPGALDSAIRKRAANGETARLAAGFCWPWSDPKSDGTLESDVVIGSFVRPWNAKSGKFKLAPNIPKESLWATVPSGIEQIGCVYTIQGFELDYVGIIWGPDLKYDFDSQSWIGDKTKSADSSVKRSKDRFVDYVKNTYRVLLSRGMKGCYVHFLDKDTERFVRSRMESRPTSGQKSPLDSYPVPDAVIDKVAEKPRERD